MWHATVSRLLSVLLAFLASRPVSGHLEANGYTLDVMARSLAEALTDSFSGDAAERVATRATVEVSFLDAADGRITLQGLSSVFSLSERPDKRAIARNMTLCVPMVLEDFNLFKEHFVHSLNAQTVRPSELGVALSGVSAEEASEFESSLRNLVKDIPIFVTSVKHKALPGENRNRCAMQSHGEVISFFDADDTMHSRRIETLEKVFQKLHPKIVIHEYRDSRMTAAMSLMEHSVGNQFPCLGADMSGYNGSSSFGLSKVTIAQGWATVSRDVFDRVQYNESRLKGEDVQFISDTVDAYHSDLPDPYGYHRNTLLLLRLPLGLYIPRRYTEILERERMLQKTQGAAMAKARDTARARAKKTLKTWAKAQTPDEVRAKFRAAFGLAHQEDRTTVVSDTSIVQLRGAMAKMNQLRQRPSARTILLDIQEGGRDGRSAEVNANVTKA